MAEKSIKIEYEIAFKNGRKETCVAELDADSLALIPPPRAEYPKWTQLTCSQCPNCPLDPASRPRCPVAENLVGTVEKFARNISYEEVRVTVRTESRVYERTLALHDALRALFGLYMATSGCPVLDKLRPLALTHLPFATIKETAYRSLSMYFLAQFFIAQRSGNANWTLDGLRNNCKDIERLNQAFHKRLFSAGIEDACLNAIGNLNCYAQFTEMVLEPESLKKLEKLFAAYF